MKLFLWISPFLFPVPFKLLLLYSILNKPSPKSKAGISAVQHARNTKTKRNETTTTKKEEEIYIPRKFYPIGREQKSGRYVCAAKVVISFSSKSSRNNNKNNGRHGEKRHSRKRWK